jgi:cellulose 1,4-beta-cellobiosidase
MIIRLLLLSVLAFSALPATAAPLQVQSCTIGSVAPFPQSPTGTSFTADLTHLAWVSASSTGSAPFCKKLTGVPNGSVSPTSGFVSSTADGGKTWTWVSIPVALAGTTTPAPPVTPPVTPPAPVAGTATISWTAVTTDTTGAKITLPISYNVYRAPTCGGPTTKVGTTAAVSYVDKGVLSGSSYGWTVTALDTNGESAQTSPQVCLTIAIPPIANAPATPAAVTAK